MLPNLEKILYTTDLGKNTRIVFRYAIRLAQQFQAQITLLHVLEPLGSYGNALLETYLPKETIEKLHQKGIAELRTTLLKRLDDFCRDELQLSPAESHLIADTQVVYGAPAQQIVKQAQMIPADLIVMGTHSYSTLNEMLIGSTARKVTQLSPIPVLIVPIKASQT